MPASPSSLSVVTDVVQAVDEPSAELSMPDSVGPLNGLHNYWVVLFSLTITGLPFAFLLTPSYLSRIDPSLERAAATLGAGPRQRFWHVTVRLLAPGLTTTFALAFSVFPRALLYMLTTLEVLVTAPVVRQPDARRASPSWRATRAGGHGRPRAQRPRAAGRRASA